MYRRPLYNDVRLPRAQIEFCVMMFGCPGPGEWIAENTVAAKRI